MSSDGMTAGTVVQFGLVAITSNVVTTWAVMFAFVVLALLATRKLRTRAPGPSQLVLEGLLLACEDAVRAIAPIHYRQITPFVTTLWGFLVVANLLGLIPGLHSPTGDLSLTLALALVVFFSVHWFGIRLQGWRTYLQHYLRPSPVLLPFHLIGEVSRTIALAVRLFGNIMSMEMIGMLLLLVAGLLVPVPLMLLHVIEALVQAYIFGMLSLVYIASGLQSQQLRISKGVIST